MLTASYIERRQELEGYFDRTAVEAWKRLTSDAPVGRIRATVRAGRERMRSTLLGWLPRDLGGRRLLDAGCGTGALAVEAAQRGAEVVAIDLSPTLIGLACDRLPGGLRVDFKVGDMLDERFGRFDHVAAMDSLIHYPAADIVRVLERLASRTDRSIVFTFAPRTLPLALMHAVGRAFPRGDRAPAIEPVDERRLQNLIEAAPELKNWNWRRSCRVATGFYVSQAVELVRI